MKLHYFHSPHGNFGDDLNGWLWPKLLPGLWDEGEDDITFVGVGTILNRLIPPSRVKIVFGSGVGYSPLPQGLDDGSWHFLAVRGPLSARAAGLPPEKVITDGAILLAEVDGLTKPLDQRTGGVVFIPHVSSTETGAWEAICERLGITYIDPRWDFHDVFRLIGNARLALTEAMHGAIVADTLRVPFVPLVTSREISSFKWMDWALSMDIPYRPIRLPHSSLLDSARDRMVASMGHGHLHRAVFDQAPHAAETLADEMLHQLARSAEHESSALGQFVSRNSKRAWRRLVKPAASKASGGLLKSLDRRLLDTCTEAVRRAMQAPSFLSDDRVFADRRGRMVEKLATVRQLAGRVDA
jgi:succinoglycan biosynthesis protein ExoV